MTDSESKTINSIAASLANSVCGEISKDPGDAAAHARQLQDLKLAVAKEGAELAAAQKISAIKDRAEFCWTFAQVLPDFNTDKLYQTRTSVVSLAAAVFIGWLLGGLLSGLLNLFGLGGDILRAAAIFGALWAGEYLTANPRSRRILLTVLGLGGLARFASMLAGGMLRITGFAGFRQAVFGAGVRPNIFKSAWLLLGAVFVFIFLSKKVGGLDIGAFRADLERQIGQDLRLACFVFENVEERDSALLKLGGQKEKEALASQNSAMSQAVLNILDSLDANQRSFLAGKLAASGFDIQNAKDDYIIWNEEEHAPLYETVGLVENGEKCRILRHASKAGGKIVRGYAQRLDNTNQSPGRP